MRPLAIQGLYLARSLFKISRWLSALGPLGCGAAHCCPAWPWAASCPVRFLATSCAGVASPLGFLLSSRCRPRLAVLRLSHLLVRKIGHDPTCFLLFFLCRCGALGPLGSLLPVRKIGHDLACLFLFAFCLLYCLPSVRCCLSRCLLARRPSLVRKIGHDPTCLFPFASRLSSCLPFAFCLLLPCFRSRRLGCPCLVVLLGSLLPVRKIGHDPT